MTLNLDTSDRGLVQVDDTTRPPVPVFPPPAHSQQHAPDGSDPVVVDAAAADFAPTTPGDWDTEPTTVQDALDQLASGGAGGTVSTEQPANSPLTLANNASVTASVTAAHSTVTNEKISVDVWYDTAQPGQTLVAFDCDLADEGQFVQEDDTKTDFVSGLVKLHDSGSAPANVVPDMTGATTPSGEVTSSGDYAGYPAWRLFDRDTNTDWQSVNSNYPYWITYDFGAGNEKAVVKARVYVPSASHVPSSYQFQGSNDGGNWDVLKNVTNITMTADSWNEYTWTNTTPYRYVRFYCSFGSSYPQLMEMEWWAGETIFPVDTYYYVRTTDANQVDLSNVETITAATITQTTPTNTDVRWLVSFDGRATWSVWDGDAWVEHTGGLAGDWSAANTKAELEDGMDELPVPQPETLDFAFALKTTDAGVSPSVDGLSLTYTELSAYAPATVGATGAGQQFEVQRIDPTHTKVTNKSGASKKVFINLRIG